MSMIRFFNIHRSWEDWVSMLMGVVIGLSPWLAGQQDNPAILANALLFGLLVFAFAQLTYVSLRRWEEIGEIACGLWLIASPFTFGYAESGALRYWHFLLGAAVVVLAALELWQDWTLSEEELAQHG
jgi:ABC-type branched-subunit amino acid transport system permease subunit